MKMDDMIDDFLDISNTFAVVGVSRDITKYGRKVFKMLKMKGFKVMPINPNTDLIGDDKCYPDLRSLPMKPDVVCFVIPPDIVRKMLADLDGMGVRKVWMQPGSESDETIRMCKEKGIDCVHDECIVVSLGKRYRRDA